MRFKDSLKKDLGIIKTSLERKEHSLERLQRQGSRTQLLGLSALAFLTGTVLFSKNNRCR